MTRNRFVARKRLALVQWAAFQIMHVHPVRAAACPVSRRLLVVGSRCAGSDVIRNGFDPVGHTRQLAEKPRQLAVHQLQKVRVLLEQLRRSFWIKARVAAQEGDEALEVAGPLSRAQDRKSTRLNSSHL